MGRRRKRWKEFKKILAFIGIIVFLIGLSAGESFGIPTLQVYSPGAVAGDSGDDMDTWFVSTAPFELWVIGGGPQTASITNLMLIVSVPEGSTGTIEGLGTGDWYGTKSDFLPAGFMANNHYPFQDSVSDFIVYEIGSFTGPKVPVSDYDASTGIIGTGGSGWIMVFEEVSFTGYEWLHFDVIGFVRTEQERGGSRNPLPPIVNEFWAINPGSHDVSATVPVPEPNTLLLLGAGLVGFGLLLRRRRIR